MRPGGRGRGQVTFFADSVSGGRFHPNGGDYIYLRRILAAGVVQLYRYDAATAIVTLADGWQVAESDGTVVFKRRFRSRTCPRGGGEGDGLVGDDAAQSTADHLADAIAGGLAAPASIGAR